MKPLVATPFRSPRRRMADLGSQIWLPKSAVRLHVEVPMIEEEAMADVLSGRIGWHPPDNNHSEVPGVLGGCLDDLHAEPLRDGVKLL